MLYRIESYEQAILFEEWAKGNGIAFDELNEGNYIEECPRCGEYEFWHSGHCSHCGYDMN